MKKLISMILTICILASVGMPALASNDNVQKNISTIDGFSYGYSYSDPAPASFGGYGAFGSPVKGNVIFETILATALVSDMAAAVMVVLPYSPAATAVAQNIARYAAGAGATWAATSTRVYYKLSTAYCNTLPGFYQYLRYEWYEDSSYSSDEKICTTYVYRFKA